MAKHLLEHATFAGAARKKTRLLLNQADVSCAAAASAAFFSNSRTAVMMKAEPCWDAANRDPSFPISGRRNGRRDPSAGTVGKDQGIKRSVGSSHQIFTTVPYDGHEWRKYGEKKISGLDFPRCYYRCTYSPCPAKKRVEQISHDDPPMYQVTYQEEHTCQNSSMGATSAAAVAAATAAPKAEPLFHPFAPQVQESTVIGAQKHWPSTPSTITEGSCSWEETCSSLDQPALPELGTLESLVYSGKLTSAAFTYSPELHTLSGLMELEPREMANYNEPSISPAGDNACSLMDQAYFPDLTTLESIDMAANYDALDMAVGGDQHDFLSGGGVPISFDSSYLDVLDQLEFSEVDSLHPLWAWQ